MVAMRIKSCCSWQSAFWRNVVAPEDRSHRCAAIEGIDALHTSAIRPHRANPARAPHIQTLAAREVTGKLLNHGSGFNTQDSGCDGGTQAQADTLFHLLKLGIDDGAGIGRDLLAQRLLQFRQHRFELALHWRLQHLDDLA